MNNNNSIYLIIIAACITAGFISGWVIKSAACNESNSTQVMGGVIKIHDTIKTPVISYKVIPGKSLNVDSLVLAVNEFWKDSLKNLYGQGKFEAKFVREDSKGKSEVRLESRIPIDPKAEVVIDEQFALPSVYPKRSFGIYGAFGITHGSSFSASLGAKYYILDYRNFSLSGSAGGKYLIACKTWHAIGRIEAEVKF
jgi:hypothetical protein